MVTLGEIHQKSLSAKSFYSVFTPSSEKNQLGLSILVYLTFFHQSHEYEKIHLERKGSLNKQAPKTAGLQRTFSLFPSGLFPTSCPGFSPTTRSLKTRVGFSITLQLTSQRPCQLIYQNSEFSSVFFFMQILRENVLIYPQTCRLAHVVPNQ